MRKFITFTVATLLTASAFGAGEIYRWKGPDGTWHYSDQPRAGAELVRGPQRPAGEAETPPMNQPAQPEPQAAEPAVTTGALPVSDEVAEEVRAAAAAAKTDQCKRNEDYYQRALQARRITKGTDAQGNPVYMTEAEADAARLQARANRDLACGPGN